MLGFLVNALHLLSEKFGIEYDVEHRQAISGQANEILQVVEAGDTDQAQPVSEKMHAAAGRYREKNAPEF